MQRVFNIKNEEETVALAQKIANISKIGDIWALQGTLGAGKSVFARAFIQQLTDATEVPSPTFTLLQTYNSDRFNIYHYDLYRIKNPGDIFELDVEEAFYSGVSLVEWPEKMGVYAPHDMWTVNIEIMPSGRKITISTDEEEKIARLSNVK